MSEHDHDHDTAGVEPFDVRREITSVVETASGGGIIRSALVNRVTSRFDVPDSRVESELTQLEKHGFVYLVPYDTDGHGQDQGQEVRVP